MRRIIKKKRIFDKPCPNLTEKKAHPLDKYWKKRFNILKMYFDTPIFVISLEFLCC